MIIQEMFYIPIKLKPEFARASMTTSDVTDTYNVLLPQTYVTLTDTYNVLLPQTYVTLTDTSYSV